MPVTAPTMAIRSVTRLTPARIAPVQP
jgi:hypothetical protein